MINLHFIVKILAYFTHYYKILDLFDRISKKKYLHILTYHRIKQNKNEKIILDKNIYSATQFQFYSHIIYFKKKYSIVSFEDIIKYKKDEFNKNLILITFDDGYKDNYLYAYPILKHFNLQAICFISPDIIRGKELFNWDKNAYMKNRTKSIQKKFYNNETQQLKNKNYLNWAEITIMAEDVFFFGSHTLTHANLELLSINKVRNELISSKTIIENNLKHSKNNHCDIFCYPFGKSNVNDDIKKIIRENYKAAVLGKYGINDLNSDINLYSLRRIGISYKDDIITIRFKLNPIINTIINLITSI